MKAYTAGMAVLAMVFAAVTMAGAAFAGQTQAERERALHQNAVPGYAQEWQMRVAQETGSVPADSAKPGESGGGAKSEFPALEISGTVYRIGIDTY